MLDCCTRAEIITYDGETMNFFVGVFVGIVLCDIFCYWLAVRIAGKQRTWMIPFSGLWAIHKIATMLERYRNDRRSE